MQTFTSHTVLLKWLGSAGAQDFGKSLLILTAEAKIFEAEGRILNYDLDP